MTWKTLARFLIILGLVVLLAACDGEDLKQDGTVQGRAFAQAEIAEGPNKVYFPTIFSSPSDVSVPSPTTEQPAATSVIAPSSVLDSGPLSAEEADPSVAMQVSQVELEVNNILTVTARPVAIGQPIYFLYVEDSESKDPAPMVEVTYNNKVHSQAETSQVLSLLSVEGAIQEAVFVLQAKTKGQVTLSVTATGEVNLSEPDQAPVYAWSGGDSKVITITIK